MKKIIPYLIYLLMTLLPAYAFGQTTPTITFVTSLASGTNFNFDIGAAANNTTIQIDFGDGTLSPFTVGTNSQILTGTLKGSTVKIYCPNITYFAAYSLSLNTLDISNAPLLEELYCTTNNLTTLDVSKNVKLKKLNCERNKLQTLDVKNCPDLIYLNCGSNSLTSIDVSGCAKLETLYCGSNSLSALALENATLLAQLTCSSNQLTTLNIYKNVNLTYLDCSYNKLTSLSLSKNTLLATLAITSNQIAYIDLSNNVNLVNLYCNDNKLTEVRLNNLTKLTLYYCKNNLIKEIYFPGTELTSIACDNNMISYLDISKQTKLTTLSCSKNNLTISGLPVSTITSYTYAPQNKIPISLNTPVGFSVKLTTEASKNGTATVFTWKTKGGTKLVEGTDYTISNGLTTFLKAQSDSVYCELSNAQFPALTGANILKTTNTKVAALTFQGNGSKNNPFQIATLEDLRTLSECQDLWKYSFVQTADIDASDTRNWNNGKGFSPIGMKLSYYTYFQGSYDGQYHTISNLYMNHPDKIEARDESFGLFGITYGTIKNLGVINADVTAMGESTGILAGGSGGSVTNCYTSGKVSGFNQVGGLIGNTMLGSIERCFSSAVVSGSQLLGGLVGISGGSLINCYSRGDLVSTMSSNGGLAGYNSSIISFCYATGKVTTGTSIGGFLGFNQNTGKVNASFWDLTTSQQTTAIGANYATSGVSVTGKTTAEMKTQNTFEAAGWDFKNETINGTNDIWTIYSGINDGYPCLSWQTPLARVLTMPATDTISAYTATANGFISEFGKDAPTSHGLCWNTTGNPTIADSKVDKGTATVTGKFSVAMTGLKSNTTYYVRAFAQNSVGLSYGEVYSFTTEIALPKLSVTNPALTTTKQYDGTTTAKVTVGTLSGMAAGEVVTITGVATYDNANAGTNKTITVKYTLSGADAVNYSAPYDYTVSNGEITAKPLTVSSTNITLRKNYDGTTIASVVNAGTLTGVITADAAKVSLSTNAAYENANAGTGKKIIVKYTLSGAAVDNYAAIPNDTLKTGIIDKIQLTIGNPDVVATKIYDGTTSATIASLGSLSGVIAADASDITIFATASYNDANIGTGKTITVVYTVNGTAKANYIAPANYTINTGIIEDKIVLAPIDPLTANCDGTGLAIPFSVLQGKPVEYQIIFGSKAIAQGFKNIAYAALPSGNTLNIIIPNGAAGTFEASLQMKSATIEGELYPFTFTVNLSSGFIKTKFNDVVLCDNSSNNFTSYQWYKDGATISGATKQFYNDKGGLAGSYQVKVTTAANETLMSCPVTRNSTLSSQAEVKAFPNALAPDQEFKIQIINISEEDLRGAVITLFNAYGNTVYKKNISSSELSLSAPATHGSYIGHLVTKEGKNLSFRIQVNQ